MLACSGFLTMMGFYVPFIFAVPRAQSGGMEESSANLIVSAIGVSNTVSRIACGILSSFPSVSPLLLNNIAITAGGVYTFFSGVSLSSAYQYGFAAVFGVCIACFSALRSIIAVDLMGLEKLTNAFGFLMLFQGIAAIIGAPIA
uniref:Major facilitator superfamily (MFS) profile domain-containing protein n=1 Tax=Megaselia scalaris TaxID=36166 RepID=T1H2F2_MEGSC